MKPKHPSGPAGTLGNVRENGHTRTVGAGLNKIKPIVRTA